MPNNRLAVVNDWAERGMKLMHFKTQTLRRKKWTSVSSICCKLSPATELSIQKQVRGNEK